MSIQNKCITKEINKTDLDDDHIIALLNFQGCEFESIHDLRSVEIEEKADKENYSMTYTFKIIPKNTMTRITMDIDLTRGGDEVLNA